MGECLLGPDEVLSSTPSTTKTGRIDLGTSEVGTGGGEAHGDSRLCGEFLVRLDCMRLSEK